ncbi:inverse autotransporter beta domain-containing protein, partial [Xenorhabdus sp. DI]|uniref:inverse autotransporter beta domain-containing protein n=1 Tax=Xenorhabdus doucetiae TaxID=351671 RepID=UPI0019B150AC
QANLNYRFGVPFSEQFSPDSVASMRTLAGSRYDLVERNNQIVLDYRKKAEELQLTLAQNAIVGYSQQKWPTPIPVTANAESRVKRLIWQADKTFINNGGDITSVNGNKMLDLILPAYAPDGQNTHLVSILAEDTNGKQTKPVTLHVTVQPLDVRQLKADKLVSESNDGKETYNLLATLAHGPADSDIIRNTPFNNINWSLESPNPDLNKEMTLKWDKSGKTNDQGQLLAKVTSAQPLKDVKVFLEVPGMPKKYIGDIGFSGLISDYNLQSVSLLKPETLFAGDKKGYTFVAVAKNKQGETLKNLPVDIKWYPETLPDGAQWSQVSNTTDSHGQLFATLNSTQPAKEIKVSASMDDGKTQTHADNPVSFLGVNDIKIGGIEAESPNKDVLGDGTQAHTYNVQVVGADGKAIPHLDLVAAQAKLNWNAAYGDTNKPYDYGQLVRDKTLIFETKDLATDGQGNLTTTLKSAVGLNKVKAVLEFVTKDGKKQEVLANTPVNFTPPEKPTGLLVYNEDNTQYGGRANPTNQPEPIVGLAYKFFSSGNGPVNIPERTMAELRDAANTPVFDPDSETAIAEVTRGSTAAAPKPETGKFFLGKENDVDAPALGLTELKLSVTNNKTGAIKAYTHTLNYQRQLTNIMSRNSATGASYVSGDNDCSSSKYGGNSGQSYTLTAVNLSEIIPVSGVSQGITLLEEYNDLRHWTLLSWAYSGYVAPDKVKLMVKDDRPGAPTVGKLVTYDMSTKQITDVIPAALPTDKSYAFLCVIHKK